MYRMNTRPALLAFMGLQLLGFAALLLGLHLFGGHPWDHLLTSGNLFRLAAALVIGALGTYIILKLNDSMEARRALRSGASVRPIHIEDDTEAEPDAVDPVQLCLDRLDAMTGLQAVKDEVRSLVARLQVEQRRAEAGLSVTAISQHMIFSGAPGVGKTEIARLLGDLFKALKVVRKGHVVEVDRAALVAGYVGQTAIKTLEKCQEALDGILFIDEAYTLTNDAHGGTGFGQEAIDTLLKFMEDNRSRVVVIAAGYAEQMNTFVHSNPGLASRFTKKLHFANYSQEELLDILQGMAAAQQFTLPVNFRAVLGPWLAGRMQQPSWANAREVRSLLERAREEQALRIANAHEACLTEITATDLHAAMRRAN